MLGAQIELYLVIDLSVNFLALFEAFAHFLVGLEGVSVSSWDYLPIMSAS
jgi:hypothetical protein